MTEKYYVGVYWLARGESAEACAQRAGRFFQLLAECDPSLGSWYEKGWTLEQALGRRVGTTQEEILRRFRETEKRTPGTSKSSPWTTRARWSSSLPSASPSPTRHTCDWPPKRARCSTAPGCSEISSPGRT